MGRVPLAAILLLATACAAEERVEGTAEPEMVGDDLPRSSEPIAPMVRPIGLDPARVALGRLLFHEPRLSARGDQSCATCHDLARGGTDHLARPHGSGDGVRDTPTVFNSGLNIAQFWDGRAASLEEQVDGPLLSPVEMASSWDHVTRLLERDADLAASFQRAYRRRPDPAAVREAIATYERTLVTVGSRFDRYLEGEQDAISAEERAGYELFKSYGCIACHQGQNVGGNVFQTIGIYDDYVAERDGRTTRSDLGRYEVTGDVADRGVFRVPSLRLVALTAPYFHDGKVPTLEAAVERMARYQLGRSIPDQDRAQIVAFLKSLSDGAEVPR